MVADCSAIAVVEFVADYSTVAELVAYYSTVVVADCCY